MYRFLLHFDLLPAVCAGVAVLWVESRAGGGQLEDRALCGHVLWASDVCDLGPDQPSDRQGLAGADHGDRPCLGQLCQRHHRAFELPRHPEVLLRQTNETKERETPSLLLAYSAIISLWNGWTTYSTTG